MCIEFKIGELDRITLPYAFRKKQTKSGYKSLEVYLLVKGNILAVILFFINANVGLYNDIVIPKYLLPRRTYIPPEN